MPRAATTERVTVVFLDKAPDIEFRLGAFHVHSEGPDGAPMRHVIPVEIFLATYTRMERAIQRLRNEG